MKSLFMALFMALAALLGSLAISSPVLAQFAGAVGKIQFHADDVVSSKGVTTLTGQVDARQGDVRILTDKMVIYSKTAGNGAAGPAVGTVAGDYERIVVIGNFYYITPEQEVRGDRGVYTADTGTFEVTGDVILVQDDSVVRGKKLIYDLDTGRVRVIADCKGRKCGSDGRVSILIKNKQAVTDARS